MKNRLRSSSGMFLVQAVVMLMLLALIATVVMELLLGRQTVAVKGMSAQGDIQGAKQVESQVNYAIGQYSSPAFGQANCDDSAASPHYPATVVENGISKNVKVCACGNPPGCTIKIWICDPGGCPPSCGPLYCP